MGTQDVERDLIGSGELSEERFDSVPFDLSNPLLKINGNFEIERANDAATPLLEGWEKEPGDVVPSTVYEKAREAMTHAELTELETDLNERTYIIQIHPFPGLETTVIQAFEVTEFLDNEIRYRSLLQACPDIFYQLDLNGRIQFINKQVTDFGYSPPELTDEHITTIVDPADEELVRRRLIPSEKDGEEIEVEGLEIKLDITGAGDRVFEVRSRCLCGCPGNSAEREIVGTVGLIREITEERLVKEQLEEKEQRLRTMTENFNEVFWMFDGDFQELIYVNQQVEDIYGISIEQLEKNGRSFFDVIYPDHRSRVKEAIERLRNGEKVELDYRVNKKEDFRRWVSVEGVPIFDDDGTVEKIIGASREITRQKQYEKEVEETREKLKRQTYEDPLLKIPNRRSFNERYREEWSRGRRRSDPLSMLLADIDYFKEYNDCYGHQQGDRCLKTIAVTLRGVLERETDFVARYGGEEFVIILPNTDEEGLAQLGEQLREAVRDREISHEESPISDYVTISLGGATVVPDPSLDREEFLYTVDSYLYKAKENGRDQILIEGVEV